MRLSTALQYAAKEPGVRARLRKRVAATAAPRSQGPLVSAASTEPPPKARRAPRAKAQPEPAADGGGGSQYPRMPPRPSRSLFNKVGETARTISQRMAQSKNPELDAEVAQLETLLDVDHQNTGPEWMEGIEHEKKVVDLPEDDKTAHQLEETYFESFFKRADGTAPEAEFLDGIEEEEVAAEDPDVQDVRRKLGPNAVMGRLQERRLRAAEEGYDVDEDGEDEFRDGKRGGGPQLPMRGNSAEARPGFELRGRAKIEAEFKEREERVQRERVRQTKLNVDEEDRLRVGDVVIPPDLEKWVLEPMGDHKARHKKQRVKEERIAAWYAEHGMYYKRKNQSTFRRDPVDETLTVRQRRIALLLRDALDKVLTVDMQHTKMPNFFIEHVEISVDMRKAKVLWNAVDPADVVKTFLRRHAAYIRRAVTERVQLKYSPALVFLHTDHETKQENMSHMLDEIEQETMGDTANEKADEDDDEDDDDDDDDDGEFDLDALDEAAQARAVRAHQ